MSKQNHFDNTFSYKIEFYTHNKKWTIFVFFFFFDCDQTKLIIDFRVYL